MTVFVGPATVVTLPGAPGTRTTTLLPWIVRTLPWTVSMLVLIVVRTTTTRRTSGTSLRKTRPWLWSVTAFLTVTNPTTPGDVVSAPALERRSAATQPMPS